MDSKTTQAIINECIATGQIDGTKTKAYKAYMKSRFDTHRDYLAECGVIPENDPDLAGWMIYHAEKED